MLEWVKLPERRSETGNIVIAEVEKDVPFAIRRVYCLVDLDVETRRGFHAHRQLEQLVICLHGSCRILLDDGSRRTEVTLAQPNRGLLLRSMIWREMFDFSQGCVLMVLASEHYDEADYIRNYDDFMQLVGVPSDSFS